MGVDRSMLCPANPHPDTPATRCRTLNLAGLTEYESLELGVSDTKP